MMEPVYNCRDSTASLLPPSSPKGRDLVVDFIADLHEERQGAEFLEKAQEKLKQRQVGPAAAVVVVVVLVPLLSTRMATTTTTTTTTMGAW